MLDGKSPGAGNSARGAEAETAGSSAGRSNTKSLRRAQLARDLIATLAEWFPAAFFVFEQRRRPLKLGIDHDVAVATAGAITVAEIKGALRYYTGNAGYLRACRAGAARVDLNGNAAGAVTADEAAHARERLARRSQRAPSKRVVAVRRASLADLRAAGRARRAAAP
jgi:ProP effector